MPGKRKKDYIKFLALKILQDISRYDLQVSQSSLIENLFNKFLFADEPLRAAYMLSRIHGFERTGKYLIYVIKKLEDGLIKYENLSQNLNTDTEFIEREILNYFSNPAEKEAYIEEAEEGDDGDAADDLNKKEHDFSPDESEETYTVKSGRKTRKVRGDEEKEKFDAFKKNYLELIRSDPDSSEENESVYELPAAEELIIEEDPGTAGEEAGQEGEGYDQSMITELNPDSERDEAGETEEVPGAGTPAEEMYEEIPEKEIIDYSEKEEQYSFTDSLTADESFSKPQPEEPVFIEKIVPESILGEEVSEILDDYKQEEEDITAGEEKPTNAVFLQYEEEVKKKNELLEEGFDDMIEYLMTRNKDPELRENIIKNILEISSYLEEYSRKLSLEIISNVYQAITLSFEKISEGKYDISDGTLKLFKSSLEFVVKLIKGEDYYLYEETLSSVENLRASLLEEKLRKEKEILSKKERQELELKLIEKYPETGQREKVKELKKTINKIEESLDALDKVSGEYQVYEALRSLSGNLIYFKEIVNLSKDLNLPKLAQVAEGSYIFIKFLHNYRINPLNPEIKEIFNYISHNLKLLIFDRHLKELDLFISYLNDPVKIFTKPDKKNK